MMLLHDVRIMLIRAGRGGDLMMLLWIVCVHAINSRRDDRMNIVPRVQGALLFWFDGFSFSFSELKQHVDGIEQSILHIDAWLQD